MEKTITTLLKAMLPMVLGVLGGAVAATLPIYHAAFCNGFL